jgi:hypothetical protein
MTLLKTELVNNHSHLKQLERGKLYRVSLKHDQMAKFIIEILDKRSLEVLSRPNEYSVTCLPNVPYTLILRAYSGGILAIHYDTDVLEKSKWTKVYDIEIEEVEQ